MVWFVLAGVANEVGHGMAGCLGRHGEVVDGAVWSYQAWQARFNEVRLGAVRHGSAW